MKLTNKQVRNIILEELRQVLSENVDFFGASFVEFKERVEAGEPALQVAEELLYQLGEGSTRIVYGFSDNPTIVLKIINTTHAIVDMDKGEDKYGFTKKHKVVSNQNEADLQMQQQYPKVFPRTFEVAGDYSWILAERVEPMNHSEMLDEFGLPRFVNKKLYKKIAGSAVRIMKGKLMENSSRKVDSFQTFYPAEATEEDEPSGTQAPKFNKPPEKPEPNIYSTQYLLKKLLENESAKNIFYAAAALDIPSSELTAKNLGISTVGTPHMVILDASLWEDRQ